MKTLIIKNSYYNISFQKEKNNRSIDVYNSFIPEDSAKYLLVNKTDVRVELIGKIAFAKSLTRTLY